ncbi:MAG: ribosomal-processing cysteine protease Prp [Bacillota bacterium]
MIKAIIFEDDKGSLIGFEISGHAHFADSGKDIVCAAVSILGTTTVNSLEEQLIVKPIYTVDEGKGYLECVVSPNLDNSDMEKAQIILKTLVIGLQSIEEAYGSYLKLQQRRWTQC